MKSEIKTVSGVNVGRDKSWIGIYDFRTKGIKYAQITGRWLYCKQCVREDSIDGIYLPEKSKDITQVLAVMAIGTGCGKWYKLTEQEKKIIDMMPQVNSTCIEPGDRILTPDEHHYGIKRSFWLPEEDFFIHETIIHGYIPRESK